MILEVAILHVKSDEKAQSIISNMQGYLSHQLQKCIEKNNRYILLVNWKTLDDHTVGFRQSPEYEQWKKLLHHFYSPFPEVEHYSCVFSGENNDN